jgi:hypothetical protein
LGALKDVRLIWPRSWPIVKVSIWENEVTINGRSTSVLKVSVQKSFKAKDGTWKTTTSFARNEVPLAMYCLQKAFETMLSEKVAGEIDGNAVEEEVIA